MMALDSPSSVEARSAARQVRLRGVDDHDLGVFFDDQTDPEATEMTVFPLAARISSRPTGQGPAPTPPRSSARSWRTAVVAGYIASWEQDGQRLLAYWIGRDLWGRGIATQALAQFTRQVTARPLHAHVACTTAPPARSGALWRV